MSRKIFYSSICVCFVGSGFKDVQACASVFWINKYINLSCYMIKFCKRKVLRFHFLDDEAYHIYGNKKSNFVLLEVGSDTELSNQPV